MLKGFVLSILFFVCTSPSSLNDSFSDDSKFRVKSITYYSFDENLNDFISRYERTLNYFENKVEYIELRNGGKIMEKHIGEYEDGKLIRLNKNSQGNESEQTFRYNQFGDVIEYIYSTKERSTQEIFTYSGQKIMKYEVYDFREPTNKILLSEGDYEYNEIENSMSLIYSAPAEYKPVKYKFNSKGQIIEKINDYKKYEIEYIGDTLINIQLTEGIPVDFTITKTIIKFNADKLLSQVVTTSDWVKESSYFSYDENGLLTEFISISEHQDGTKEYSKYIMGPYGIKGEIIFPSWNVDCGFFNNKMYINMVDYILKENRLNDAIKNNQGQHFKSIPNYYTVYNSKNGTSWTPERKLEFKFEEVK